MDLSTNNQYDDSSKENVPPGLEAAGVQRSKRRPVLGLLSENEHGRSLGRVSPAAPLPCHVLLRSFSAFLSVSAGDSVFQTELGLGKIPPQTTQRTLQLQL